MALISIVNRTTVRVWNFGMLSMALASAHVRVGAQAPAIAGLPHGRECRLSRAGCLHTMATTIHSTGTAHGRVMPYACGVLARKA